ncbi:hypothetical protein HDV00_006399 [Rhizophlyctis rosea]|nr:hypothetical protein HDV00_006399 [Rhizophlyctis rosea]
MYGQDVGGVNTDPTTRSSATAAIDRFLTSQSVELDWSKFRIAVVDDNHINLKILCRYLKRFLNISIHSSDQFTDGQQCLEALKTREYDLILLDIEMPVLDGCETTICIRNGLDSPPITTPTTTSALYPAYAPALTPTLTPTSPPMRSNNSPGSPEWPVSPMTCAVDYGRGERNEFPFPVAAGPERMDVDCETSIPRRLPPYISTQPPTLSSTPTTTYIPPQSPSPILPANRTTPIIAVTTNALPHQQRHYLSLGMDDVVAKPLVAGVLVESVKKALRGVERRRGSGWGGVAAGRWRMGSGGDAGGVIGMEVDGGLEGTIPASVSTAVSQQQIVPKSIVPPSSPAPRPSSSPSPALAQSRSTSPAVPIPTYKTSTPPPRPPKSSPTPRPTTKPRPRSYSSPTLPHHPHPYTRTHSRSSPPPQTIITPPTDRSDPASDSDSDTKSDTYSSSSSSSIASILGTELTLSSRGVPDLLRRVGSRSLGSRTPSPVPECGGDVEMK